MAKDTEKKEADNGEAKAPPSIMKIVIVAVTLSLLVGGGLVGGTFIFVNNMHAEQMAAAASEDGVEGEGETEPAAPPKYHSMDPKFVVSFNNHGSAQFMQFSIQIMTRDGEVIKKIEEHMPVIRSSLLLLFGGQNYDAMLTREGKEKLLEDTKADINTTLQKLSGNEEMVTAIEEAYFTSFVIQ